MTISSTDRGDALPCRHGLEIENIAKVKELLRGLPEAAPNLLEARDIDGADWEMLLRAAVESIRGSSAATTSVKRRFLEAVLDFGKGEGSFSSWSFIGTQGRSDYRVDLPDGTAVCIEAKGCPDGNNTTIWDRPGWANEFVVWCQCPESLAKPPGHGTWSGVATRLLPKMTAEREVVDAMFFWDGRCGSNLRRCPKDYGVVGLRSKATAIPSQSGKDAEWVPPPCIYLFPRSRPHLANNPTPAMHTLATCKFAAAMLDLFNVPESERQAYVHHAGVSARGTPTGVQIQVTVTSRCWKDGEDREVMGRWKDVRRE